MRRGLVLAATVIAVGASVAAEHPPLAISRAQAQAPGWKAEFEEVCAKTQDAMALSTEELRRLVARCDALKPAIEALGDTERKVFSRRLKACRDLYAFVLESRDR